MLLLVNSVHEKNIAESQDRQNFENVCALFVLYILVTTLQLCYMRMHSFSANLMRIFFHVYYQLYAN